MTILLETLIEQSLIIFATIIISFGVNQVIKPVVSVFLVSLILFTVFQYHTIKNESLSKILNEKVTWAWLSKIETESYLKITCQWNQSYEDCIRLNK